jgi:hypothetical protein
MLKSAIRILIWQSIPGRLHTGLNLMCVYLTRECQKVKNSNRRLVYFKKCNSALTEEKEIRVTRCSKNIIIVNNISVRFLAVRSRENDMNSGGSRFKFQSVYRCPVFPCRCLLWSSVLLSMHDNQNNLFDIALGHEYTSIVQVTRNRDINTPQSTPETSASTNIRRLNNRQVGTT